MLSRTSASGGASLDQFVDDCGKLIRKRSTTCASNCSNRSFTSSSIASSCPSSISSSEFNDEEVACLNHHHHQQQYHFYQETHPLNVNQHGSINNEFNSGEEFYGMGVGVGGVSLSSENSIMSSMNLNNSMCSQDPIQNYYTSSSSNRINIDKDEMLANAERKKSIWYYVNEEDESEKYISSESMTTLLKAFEDPTVQMTKVKQVKEKQPSQVQRQFLSYIPPSEKTKRYDDVNLTQITSNSTQIKGGSRQKYFLIGGKSRRGNKH
ncbi:predicted protein [Naegleria gruberi]|uniref:Predicted protein n=1 Tax=Naegleria gruberi TaxID=5762 RepID=D2V641_NAEGR|nr:uncharacterized protein NAEGRDRAFT_64302 [Naegleria gruberi]EFC47765.1 predicted protein [Naegleria gruberi]|eukprot:XP_002680509.1 predicted protein [Naegleria gruberi strain NEG-M]